MEVERAGGWVGEECGEEMRRGLGSRVAGRTCISRRRRGGVGGARYLQEWVVDHRRIVGICRGVDSVVQLREVRHEGLDTSIEEGGGEDVVGSRRIRHGTSKGARS